MFTGIIEELGVLKKIKDTKSGKELTIQTGIVTEDLQIGDSLAVNGVCLTAVEIKKKSVKLDLIEETLNLDRVNKYLEAFDIDEVIDLPEEFFE